MANRNQSRCGCGATIIWGKTPGGSNMPLDPTPIRIPAGHYILFEEHGQTKLIPAPREVYAVHWTSCPNAKTYQNGHHRSEVARA